MADNYLEKKMEEHQRGTAPKHPRSLNPLGTPRGTVCLPLSFRRIFVAGVDCNPEAGREIVKAFGNAGCEVGFSCTDLRFGRVLAQSSSTRHYPMQADAALTHFTQTKGVADLIITLDGKGATLSTGSEVCSISSAAEELAPTVLTLALASAAALRRMLFTPIKCTD